MLPSDFVLMAVRIKLCFFSESAKRLNQMKKMTVCFSYDRNKVKKKTRKFKLVLIDQEATVFIQTNFQGCNL